VEIEGDLIQLLEYAYYSGADLEKRWIIPSRMWNWLGRSRNRVMRQSRENIHHHYDIGNDFYRLWLDADMVYTCAYYPTLEATLEQAQQAKMEHVCRKLRLRPGDTVVEAGCGWGALALYMARNHGVTVKAMNISHEQIAFARQAARDADLAGRVEFIEDDYRNIHGKFDVFVSVGMLEHVGRGHYRDLGRVINRSLTAAGRGLLHSIGRNKPCPMNAWIEQRIFPGAYPPSLREMVEILEPWDFSILDVENLRLHYAKTLMDWLERYEKAFDAVTQRYDSRFARAWRMYLAGSIAAFTAGSLQLFQVTFTRPTVNDIAWTRAHLYDT
jgi:cyclopropane-fatty-acyl-phospholipid synthase